MNSEHNRLCLRWYVVHTHPRQEERAAQNLRAHRVETFAPHFQERRCNEYTGKPTYLAKPLFPRYIFVRFQAEDLFHKVRFTRGVHSIVSFNDGPVPVEDAIISILQSRVTGEGFVKMNEDLNPGDEVIVIGGSFQNFSGVFERQSADSQRVSILLQAVNYKVHAIIDRDMIRKLDKTNCEQLRTATCSV